MRPTRISLGLGATGYSPPVLHDWYQTPNCITLGLTFSQDAAGAYSINVEYTVDDLSSGAFRQVAQISRVGTTITVTGDYGQPATSGGLYTGDGGGHGLSAGDLVQLVGAGILDGWYNVVTTPSDTSYTLTSPNNGTFNAPLGSGVITGRVFVHSSLNTIVAATGRVTGNYAFPVTSSRLHNTAAGSAGQVTMAILQGGMSS